MLLGIFQVAKQEFPVLRVFLSLAVLVLLASCAGDDSRPAGADGLSFQQRLDQLAAFQNARQPEQMRTYFTKNAVVQTPVTPRGAKVDQFLQSLTATPYTVSFSETETVYSLPGRAVTRSRSQSAASGRFKLQEQVTVDWQVEDGYWRIARMRFDDWSSVIGTWRKAGPNREGSMELRILPGGSYRVYLDDDYTLPAFRGKYTLEGSKVTFTEIGADDRGAFDASPGSYRFLRTQTGGTFRRIQDDHPWRGERFDGDWAAR